MSPRSVAAAWGTERLFFQPWVIIGHACSCPSPSVEGEYKPEPDAVDTRTFPLLRPNHLLDTLNRFFDTLSWETMAKDYSQLWKDVTSARDEGKAVRTLAEILVDREGRAFIGALNRADAELCMEMLDHVSLSLIRPICCPQMAVLLGNRRA